MGPSQAFSIFPLLFRRYQRIPCNLSEEVVTAVQSNLIVSKDMVMKNILKYSNKYLTVEVIQGIKIFQIRSTFVGGESNPGLPRGRREFYH